MKRKAFLLVLPALLASTLTLNSCKTNDPDKNPTVAFEAPLTAQNVVGQASASTGTGLFSGTYNKETNVLSYTVSYTGIAPTLIYIALGAAGTNGQTVFTLTTNQASPVTGQLNPLTQAQENDLVGGNYYVVINSARYPKGDVRGNIMLKKN